MGWLDMMRRRRGARPDVGPAAPLRPVIGVDPGTGFGDVCAPLTHHTSRTPDTQPD